MPPVVRPLLRRPRLASCGAVLLYLVVALGFTPFGGAHRVEAAASCPAELLGADEGTLTVLQGNLWMLPYRPLLIPRSFATDRRSRMERFVALVGACRPDVIALQEVFESSVVRSLDRALPDYRVHTSGARDALGSVNRSGLVTLTRVPARAGSHHPFGALPAEARLIERLGRKGFLVTEVAARGIHLTLVNTHLFSAQSAAEEVWSFAQLAELEAFVRGARDEGRTVAVVGDFNLEPAQIAPRLGAQWRISDTGPTYDPVLNPYTGQGANHAEAHADPRVAASGRRTIDLLALSSPLDVELHSGVLERPFLSDHQFVAHRIARR